MPGLPYDPVNDFTPIMETWSFPSVLTVPAASQANSALDLFALTRTKPGSISYASSGVGSGGHLLGSMLSNALDVPMTHVPYKGAGQAMPDVVVWTRGLQFCQLSARSSLTSTAGRCGCSPSPRASA